MNKISDERLVQYVNMINQGFKNNIKVGLYFYRYLNDDGFIVNKLFISQINMQDNMFNDRFRAKKILDTYILLHLTSESHIENTYCSCGSKSHNTPELLFNGEVKEQLCTCEFDYEKMAMEQVQKHIMEQTLIRSEDIEFEFLD